MNNRYLFLIILVIAIGSGIYFFKDEVFGPHSASLWDFVPENAVSVFEPNDAVDLWNRFLTTSHWVNLSRIPGFNSMNDDLIFLDSLTGSNGTLDKALVKGNFLISTHVVSSTSFDHMFYVGIQQPAEDQSLLDLSKKLLDGGGLKYSERIYRGQVIIEISSMTKTFSYFLEGNYLVGSFTPFLTEDAIRTVQNASPTFREAFPGAFQFASLEYDAGNLYLGLSGLSDFARLFFKDTSEGGLDLALANLDGEGFMDFDFDKDYLFGNGFWVPTSGESYLEVFSQEIAVETNFYNLVPQNAGIVFYQAFGDPGRWHAAAQDYLQSNSTGWPIDSFVTDRAFELERMYSWMANQLVLVEIESVESDREKLLLIETSDIYESLNQLNKLSESINAETGDTLYFERYGESTIRLLNEPDFPYKIFGPWYKGFAVTYYTTLDDYLVLSNTIETLKDLINDRDDENVWARSLSRTQFLESAQDESNIGILVNPSRGWNYLAARLNEQWSDNWKTYSRNVQMIDMASLQISAANGKYYSSLSLRHRPQQIASSSTSPRSEARANSIFRSLAPLTIKPKVVRNHNNGQVELLIQDSLSNLSLLTVDGRQQWQRSLGPVSSEIFQVDYFNNKKLQYIWLTDSSLYLVDRNGEDVEGFPINISDIESDKFRLVDYDNTKNYRFLIDQEDGDVFMLDKVGNRLEGWNPRKFRGRFVVHPRHVRVRSRDVFIGINESGVVYVTNRRGEFLDGFPLDLGVSIEGGMYYRPQASFERTLFTVVSKEGELIRFNLLGQVLDRTQLFRSSRDTRHWIVNESQNKGFVIGRQELNRFAVLDNNGEERFEKDYLTNNPVAFQYYNFGADRELFIISHAEPNKVLLYDGQGNQKVSAIASNFPVSVIHSEARSLYQIYTASADSVVIYTFSE